LLRLVCESRKGGKDNRLVRINHHSGVDLCVEHPYPIKWIVRFSISITTTHLWSSNYSEYQQYLYNRICGYKENNVPHIGYQKISQIFNEEGLRTPRNSVFTNSIIHSIYKKGKIREERVNREDIIEVSQPIIEELR